MGWNISSNFGKRLFRFMSVIVPLMPTFALVLYNGVQLESLVTRFYERELNNNNKKIRYEHNFNKVKVQCSNKPTFFLLHCIVIRKVGD